MGGASRSSGSGYLKFSVNLPNFQFEVETDSPEQTLPEVRRILEAVGVDQEGEDLSELRGTLSDEFVRNVALCERIESAGALGEEVRVVKRALALEEEYDLENGKQARRLDAVTVKAAIVDLFSPLEGEVRDCIAHIRGDLSREQQHIVMDAIRQRLGVNVRPRFFTTRKDLEGQVLVEAVCFGAKL